MPVRHALLALLLAAPEAAAAQPLQATRLGTYATGLFAQGAAEVATYDPATRRLFFVNAAAAQVVALDASNPADLRLAFVIDVTPYGAGANSVALVSGLATDPATGAPRSHVAVAVEAAVKTDPGQVVLFSTLDGAFAGKATVGPLPDAVTFSRAGATPRLLVANEGEPSADYSVDPLGSISVVDIAVCTGGSPCLFITDLSVTTLDFTAFNAGGPRNAEITADPSIRVFGPSASVAQDLEPEFIAVSPDGRTAYVSLQENNAIAVVDLGTSTAPPTIAAVRGLGYKDHAIEGNGLDASDRDTALNVTTWRVYGMYQPDGLAAHTIGGQTYVFMANEGDARDYAGFSEEVRVKDLALDPVSIPNGPFLRTDARLGRLTVTRATGDAGADGDHDALYAFGARSFSIHDATGARVFDSGDGLERQIAALVDAGTLPRTAFNATNDDNNSFDNRSDNKGPEPEGVVVGEVGGRTYAFVGLERVSAVIVYDVTTPTAPTYAGLLVNRDFSVPVRLPGGASNPAAGDLGPEGLAFIAPADSPTGQALLVTSNEVSGTVTVWALGAGSTGVASTPRAEPGLLTVASARPNPARTPRVAFALAAPAEVEVVVIDALGREVGRVARSLAAGPHEVEAPVGGLPGGVYHARVEASAGGVTTSAATRFTLVR